MTTLEVNLNPSAEYYILLSDNTGKRYEKKNFLKKITSSNVEEPIGRFDAKAGTLYEKPTEMKQPNNINMIGIVPIEKSDNEIYCLDVHKTDVIALSSMELRLLLPVKENEERLKTVLDCQQFKRALNAEIGDIVILKPEFRNVEHDMKYGIIKDISPYCAGLCFYVSFKVRLNLFTLKNHLAKICLFKVSNKNTIKMCEICL